MPSQSIDLSDMAKLHLHFLMSAQGSYREKGDSTVELKPDECPRCKELYDALKDC